MKKAIGILCKDLELYFSLRRALKPYFPDVSFFHYDISIAAQKCVRDVETLKNVKKEGSLIAFFWDNDDDILTCRLIKYLRIKKKLRFPIICCTQLRRSDLIEKYPILAFGGAKVHFHCRIPFEVNTLAKSISIAVCMDSCNYDDFVEEYSKKFKDFYTDIIEPLLNSALRNINCKSRRKGIIKKLIPLIKKTNEISPVTCHRVVKFNGEEETIIKHLNDKMTSLTKLPTSKVLHELQRIYKIWFDIVTQFE